MMRLITLYGARCSFITVTQLKNRTLLVCNGYTRVSKSSGHSSVSEINTEKTEEIIREISVLLMSRTI